MEDLVDFSEIKDRTSKTEALYALLKNKEIYEKNVLLYGGEEEEFANRVLSIANYDKDEIKEMLESIDFLQKNRIWKDGPINAYQRRLILIMILMLVSIAHCIKSLQEDLNSQLAWAYAAEATSWLGVINGILIQIDIAEQDSKLTNRSARRAEASASAKRGWEKSPKTEAKNLAKEFWMLWKKDPTRYKGQTQFANDVLTKVEVDKNGEPIISFNTIMKKYIPEWNSEGK